MHIVPFAMCTTASPVGGVQIGRLVASGITYSYTSFLRAFVQFVLDRMQKRVELPSAPRHNRYMYERFGRGCARINVSIDAVLTTYPRDSVRRRGVHAVHGRLVSKLVHTEVKLVAKIDQITDVDNHGIHFHLRESHAHVLIATSKDSKVSGDGRDRYIEFVPCVTEHVCRLVCNHPTLLVGLPLIVRNSRGCTDECDHRHDHRGHHGGQPVRIHCTLSIHSRCACCLRSLDPSAPNNGQSWELDVTMNIPADIELSKMNRAQLRSISPMFIKGTSAVILRERLALHRNSAQDGSDPWAQASSKQNLKTVTNAPTQVDALLDWYESRKSTRCLVRKPVPVQSRHVPPTPRHRMVRRHATPPPQHMSSISIKSASQVKSERKAHRVRAST